MHLLVCPTQDAARTLADTMFAWSKLDSEGVAGVGRYAARGALRCVSVPPFSFLPNPSSRSYLESEAILAARTFLSHFLSLVLAAHPTLLVVRFPYPPPSTPLAKTDTISDELLVTKLASLNFLQLAVRTCQAGAGESIEKTKAADGSMKEVKGKGRSSWTALVARYEREVGWLKKPEAKEVSRLFVLCGRGELMRFRSRRRSLGRSSLGSSRRGLQGMR